ncbi:MAG: DUF1273 family protein [Clostridia bacterium]|nr:DUF1273 family protein [Clostridia bacterium]
METRIRTVAFTGHRNMNREDVWLLPSLLEEIILRLSARGAVVFRAGGAMGFDTLAALKVLDMQARLPQLELELVLPCRNQTERWDAASVRTYNYILNNATRHSFLFDSYTEGCMLARDRRLVEGADVCVAYCARSHGGTAYTCTHAIKNGLELINLYDLLHP